MESIYDYAYQGTRYTYGFTLRPLDINTHPKLGCILGSYNPEDKRARFGTVQYARLLEEVEYKKWELIPLDTLSP